MEEGARPVKRASSRAGAVSKSRDAEDGHRPEQSPESQGPQGLDLHQLLDLRGHPLMDEDLAALGLAAQTSSEVGHGADGAVVPAPLESDGADGGIALRDPYAEGQVVAALLPCDDHALHALAHGHGHANGALRRIRDWDGIVE